MITFTIEGQNKLTGALEQIAQYSGQASLGDLSAAAAPIFRDAQENCPVITGNLVQSGFFAPGEDTPTLQTVVMGYTAPYAFHVHETSRYHAKWFENALTRGVSELGAELSIKIQERADTEQWTGAAASVEYVEATAAVISGNSRIIRDYTGDRRSLGRHEFETKKNGGRSSYNNHRGTQSNSRDHS